MAQSESDVVPISTDTDAQSSKNMDFVNYWVNTTVEKEILRGTKLRREKKKIYFAEHEYDVGNINLNKSPCPERSRHSRRLFPNKFNGIRTNTYFHHQKPSSPPRKYDLFTKNTWKPSTSRTGDKCRRKCPMRIAELATPTKRQCIDTWRNKCYILPGFMVERLKQRVMDQRPVVHIQEAISCFKKWRSPSTKRLCKKETAKDTKESLRLSEIRNMCAIFGLKISRKLNKPLDITLNSHLEKISKVVAKEIADIMSSRKKNDMNIVKQLKIHTEMSCKVTIWIATILEESSYKLLEDDLRELEEEEGPVLDFIDDLVDNIVNICEPNSLVFGDKYIDNKSEISSLEDIEDNVMDEQYEKGILSPDESLDFDTAISDQMQTSIYDTGELLSVHNSSVEADRSPAEIDNIKETVEITKENEEYSSVTDLIKYEINDIIDNIGREAISDQMQISTYGTKEPFSVLNSLNETDQSRAIISDAKIDNAQEAVEIIKHNYEYGSVTDHIKNEINDIIDNLGRETISDQMQINTYYTEESFSVLNSLDEDGQSPVTISNSEIDNVEEHVEVTKNNKEYASVTEHINIEFNDIISNIDREVTHDINTEGYKDQDGVDIHVNMIDASVVEYQPLDSDLQNESVSNGEIDYNNIEITDITEIQDDHQFEVFDDGANQIKKVESINQNEDLNVSGVVDIFSEETADEKNKKVKFSDTDIVMHTNSPRLNVHSELHLFDTRSEEEQVSWKPSIDNITFSGPNTNFLSNADESWPRDISVHVLKPSESVSRSITSMGKIMEIDELVTTPEPEEGITIEMGPDFFKPDIKTSEPLTRDNLEIIPITKSDEKTEFTIQAKHMFSEPLKDKSIDVPQLHGLDIIQNTADKASLSKNKDRHKVTIDAITGDMQRPTEEILKETAVATLESNKSPLTNIIENKIENSNIGPVQDKNRNAKNNNKYKNKNHENKEKNNFSYPLTERKMDSKVHPQTAPAWVTRPRGEPSADTPELVTKNELRQKMMQCDIRKWCRVLELGYTNLEVWYDWIENTCNNVYFLRQKQDILIATRNKGRHIKDWIKLKKCIDEDAALWTKLNQRNQHRIKRFNKINNNKYKIVSTYCTMCMCKRNAKKNSGCNILKLY